MSDERDLADLREDYASGGLAEADLTPDPVSMFSRWYDDASSAAIGEPNAMVVSTVDVDGAPSSRFVLLKGFGPHGFRFFTHTGSRKGRGLAAEPRCALLFPWHQLERQVRVDGHAVPVPRAEVEEYFARRPRGSRIGAWASQQSAEVASRDELTAAYAEAERRFADTDDVPAPPGWGGYDVVPDAVEFWQGRTGRMHDRLVYERSGDGWTVRRLAP
ncbi:pyridoxamine 5'-phosphate oxidase [Nocardioides sp. ChNu-99]|uniref:pyridoxamine 5'-phosphate oxidase n=1 Tax=Nocardioides sp. ChNu-99 TaxID=2839897 RepID=UPI002404C775|nr:pyridoxamine 5'-phosphate oxidase [Nocardioides sp. ChNu-99]MDF9716329.1 pyridoxamine 5'-phosphate oxidase [Nocardioides sp. ChNu-99]